MCKNKKCSNYLIWCASDSEAARREEQFKPIYGACNQCGRREGIIWAILDRATLQPFSLGNYQDKRQSEPCTCTCTVYLKVILALAPVQVMTETLETASAINCFSYQMYRWKGVFDNILYSLICSWDQIDKIFQTVESCTYCRLTTGGIFCSVFRKDTNLVSLACLIWILCKRLLRAYCLDGVSYSILIEYATRLTSESYP